MNIWQIMMLIWMMISATSAGRDHGKPREGKNNFFATLIVIAFNAWILHKGGFW
jgi:hypothetical protein